MPVDSSGAQTLPEGRICCLWFSPGLRGTSERRGARTWRGGVDAHIRSADKVVTIPASNWVRVWLISDICIHYREQIIPDRACFSSSQTGFASGHGWQRQHNQRSPSNQYLREPQIGQRRATGCESQPLEKCAAWRRNLSSGAWLLSRLKYTHAGARRIRPARTEATGEQRQPSLLVFKPRPFRRSANHPLSPRAPGRARRHPETQPYYQKPRASPGIGSRTWDTTRRAPSVRDEGRKPCR